MDSAEPKAPPPASETAPSANDPTARRRELWDLAVKVGTIKATYDLVKDVMADVRSIVSTIVQSDPDARSWTLTKEEGPIQWHQARKGESLRLRASDEVLVIFRKGVDSINSSGKLRCDARDPDLLPGQRMVVNPFHGDQTVHFPSDNEYAILPLSAFQEVCDFLFDEVQVMLAEQGDGFDDDVPYAGFWFVYAGPDECVENPQRQEADSDALTIAAMVVASIRSV